MPVERIFRRADHSAEVAGAEGSAWDLVVRPKRAVRNSWIVATVLFAIFTVGGIWLRTGSTGVHFRVADQVAMILFGAFLAGAVLMLTRPRLRVGPSGVSVRNVLGDSDFPWEYIRGVSFADRKAWARLELLDDEYVPLLALRSNDKERTAHAMEQFRELGARYTESSN
ncbi:PH domain-containing protein [Nocardia callitridis]|uniref:PH domain-containing protein n=1 Tax=Nocardia callitridis TaxID=648753 RepID=A0ABP9KBC7_9NOCA